MTREGRQLMLPMVAVLIVATTACGRLGYGVSFDGEARDSGAPTDAVPRTDSSRPTDSAPPATDSARPDSNGQLREREGRRHRDG